MNTMNTMHYFPSRDALPNIEIIFNFTLEIILAVTADLEVQILACPYMCHTFYTCTKALLVYLVYMTYKVYMTIIDYIVQKVY